MLTSELRRRSRPESNSHTYATLPLQNDSVDELPLPPTPLNEVQNPFRYESVPTTPNGIQNKSNNSGRSERKSRTSGISSAAKRSQSQPPQSLPPSLNGIQNSSILNTSNGISNTSNGILNTSNGLPTSPNGHVLNLSNSSGTYQGVPTIDRHKKPSRGPRDGYHTYNAHRSPSQNYHENSMDRRNHMRDMKMVSV